MKKQAELASDIFTLLGRFTTLDDFKKYQSGQALKKKAIKKDQDGDITEEREDNQETEKKEENIDAVQKDADPK